MSFELRWIGGFNPFEWLDLCCPVCQAKSFLSLSAATVSCDCCCAKFRVRHTAGDPGCVIDCFTEGIYAPERDCRCGVKRRRLYDFQVEHSIMSACQTCGSWHSWLPKPEYGTSSRLTDEEIKRLGLASSYTLILKLGDYCSGWTGSHPRPSEISQRSWDAWQESNFAVARVGGDAT